MPGLKYLALTISLALITVACDSSPTRDTAQDQGTLSDSVTASDSQTPILDLGRDIADAGRMGTRPDELPTEGAANLAGADDLTAAVDPGQVRAGRVDRDEEKLRGPEANCRLGDFRMDNAVVSLCIQAETTFSNFSFYGGNIIDAHRADRPGTDTLREIVIAPGIGEVSVEEIGILKDGSDGLAIVRTSGRAQGALIIQGVLPNSFVPPDFKIITEYRLSPDTDTIDVWTWLHADRGAGGTLMGMDFVYFGDRTRMFKPGHQPDGSGPPMTFIAADAKDVSYAWAANGEQFTLFILAAIGIPGAPVQLGQLALDPDDMHLLRRTLTIGTGDVESVRQAPEDGLEVTLRGVAGTQVDIETPAEAAISRVRLDENGIGRVALTPGEYVAHTHGFAGGDVERPFTAVAGLVVELDQPQPATLTVTAVDAEGRPLAVRTDLSGPATRRVFVVDEETVQIPAGEWNVVSTRGWHFNVDQQTVTLAPGQAATIQVTLTEVIPLEGWASGEFHQHASPSLDSEAPVELRVLSNLVEGVDFMIPSDHDIIYDYASLIERMGLSHRITAPLTGEEVSPRFTHLGVYGIPYDPHVGAGGAVRLPVNEGGEWRMKTIPELIEDVRARGARAIQVNHPRASQGYFDHVGYEPHVPIESLDHHEFSEDFDSLEVYNSAGDFCRVLADWLGLLNQGLRVTAVGNSDTHSAKTAVGYPRNYLPTLSPDRVGVTADEIVAALEQGTMTIGGGAMMDFPDGPHPGETLTIDEDTVSIRVRIRTPGHLKVDRLIAFINGIPALDQPIETTKEAIVDLDEEIILPNTADGHIVLLALSEDRLQFTRPGQPVFAMANPIWLDRAGDGIIPVGPAALDLLDMPYCD